MQSAMMQAGLSKALLQSNIQRNIFFNTKNINFLNNNRTVTNGICTFHNKRLDKSHRKYLDTVKQQTMATAASTSGSVGGSNHLDREKSPYLLQHAKNPVNWFPWGEAAFQQAKKENKPIFLSIGYSTCHWCHVMERESFESESVAEILNRNYVSIKVDREERPDVDRIYMSYVQRTTGNGGWPMSVFLTPNLEPIFGGTYFPPEDSMGRVGFKSLLELIAKQWQKEHVVLNQEARESVKQLRKLISNKFTRNAKVPDGKCWQKCLNQMSQSYEENFGGFSSAPKFPQPSMFNFLFHVYGKNKSSGEGKKALEMCLHTLRCMAAGGVHDHVNCGFARYSVDEKWHLPHFEKMLYDQSQLAVSYVDAYLVSKDRFFAEIVEDILTYVGRDLSHPDGGFYGAEDADSYPTEGASHKKEGAFCVWEFEEVRELLTETTHSVPDFDVYSYHFNIEEGGNVPPRYDPHHELKNQNVLSCFGSYQATADKYELPVDRVKEVVKKCNKILYDARQKRPKPHVDTKIVTAWNGLMISGFAKAGFALKNAAYTDRAVQAANFIRKNLYRDQKLLRCCYGNDKEIMQTAVPILGFLDDYAFLIRGLIDLYEATMDGAWLHWCESLQEQQNAIFWDKEGHGYFNSSSDDKTVIVRDKEDQDGAEPCGNSVSVHNLLRLAAYLDRKDLRLMAEQILCAYSERLSKIPIALPEMSSALMLYHSTPPQVFIAGQNDDKHTQALLDVVRTRFLPGRLLAVADGPGGRAGLLYTRNESLAKLKPVQGKSAAYVCRNFACALPVTNPEDLATSLDADS